VRSSDVIVVVLGFLYGSTVPGTDVSYTQAEYDEAQQLKKTCLVYVRDKDSLVLLGHKILGLLDIAAEGVSI
jgi:Domain of unknown function (DUF4062)